MTLEEIAKAYEAEARRLTEPQANLLKAFERVQQIYHAIGRDGKLSDYLAHPSMRAHMMGVAVNVRDVLVEEADEAIAEIQAAVRAFHQSSFADSLPPYVPPEMGKHAYVQGSHYICGQCGREAWRTIHRVEQDMKKASGE